jgi:3'-phosphoadenosine 5'-phosphosulfate sulfotransferase
MQIIPRQIIPFHLSHSCNARETRVAKRALKTFSKRTLRNCRAESRQKPRSSSQIGNHDCLITIMFAKAESRSVICGDAMDNLNMLKADIVLSVQFRLVPVSAMMNARN